MATSIRPMKSMMMPTTDTPKARTKPGQVIVVGSKVMTATDVARVIVSPQSSAMRIAVQAQTGSKLKEVGPDMQVLAEELRSSVKKLRQGDLAHVEDMLMHQATALQAMFTGLAERALSSDEIPTADLLFRYALRSQAQCRATLEALVSMKAPPAVYARQANITTGPQQINNGGGPSTTLKAHAAPNELSGEVHELRADAGAPVLAGPVGAPMPSMGSINGTTDL
jgi:hypothetical protein